MLRELGTEPGFLWTPSGVAHSGAVVYVHGYGDTAKSALSKHRLEAQFSASGLMVPFIIPEAPSDAGSRVVSANLEDLLMAAGLRRGTPTAAVVHSGGYRTLLRWLSSPALKHIILLDAAYGGLGELREWAKRSGHSMQIVGHDTAANSRQLAKDTGSPYLDAKSHMGIVTEGELIPALLRRSPIPARTGVIVKAAMWGLLLLAAWRVAK